MPDNLSNLKFWKVKGTAVTGVSRLSTITPTVVHGIIVASHTTGVFSLINGTATGTTIIGSYSPATGSSVLTWEPLAFDSGLFIATSGTLAATLLYND